MARSTLGMVYLALKDGIWAIQLAELKHLVHVRGQGLPDEDLDRIARKIRETSLQRHRATHVCLDIRAWKPADYRACAQAITNGTLRAFAKERLP